MTSEDEALFAAFANAICRAIVGNIIETRAALNVLLQRGLLSVEQIEASKQQAPPELVQRLEEELYTEVTKNMNEQYQKFLTELRGPVQ